jgi:hypothetical protein
MFFVRCLVSYELPSFSGFVDDPDDASFGFGRSISSNGRAGFIFGCEIILARVARSEISTNRNQKIYRCTFKSK